MAPRLRLTRRPVIALSETAYRNLKRFADDAELSQSEALTFLFENFGSVTNEDNLTHRLRLFRAALAEGRE